MTIGFRIRPANAIFLATQVCGRPLRCKQDSDQLGLRSRHCRMSGLSMQHSFAGGPIWCSWIGSKSLQRARSSAWDTDFSNPVFNDLLPLCCLSSGPRFNLGYPHSALLSAGSAEPRYSVSGKFSSPGSSSFPLHAVTLPRPSPPQRFDGSGSDPESTGSGYDALLSSRCSDVEG